MEIEKLKEAYKYLVSRSVAKKEDIDKAFEESKKSKSDIFDVLIGMKILDEEELTKAKSDFLGVNYINLKGKIINDNVLKKVTEKAAMLYKIVPFEKIGNKMKVAMIDPTNIDALDVLKFISLGHNVDVKIYLVSKSGFANAMKQYKGRRGELDEVLKSVEEQSISKEEREIIKKKEIERIAEEAPISRIVDIIITHAVEGGASDIHIEPSESELRIRYRLDGVLYNSLVLPKKTSLSIVSRIKILSNLKIDETRKPQDGRFRFEINAYGDTKKSVDLRVSTFPTVNGEKIVMRILDKSSSVSSLESLGISKIELKLINKNIKKPFGIILITGPTGSGKTTTLYSMLKLLNKEGVNIVTLEDPVEYFMPGINQSQIRSEIGYSFSSGLRAILRQDPDIIMVGEIRDKETAELATHAALTGHLVLSTLHTNNALGVIPRLIDMGIEPFLISSSLNMVIAQRLIRKICGYCKEEAALSYEEKEIIIKNFEKLPKVYKKENFENEFRAFRGKGCRECKYSGFSGRTGIYEILYMTSELESIISSHVTENEIEKEAIRQGMKTMKQDGIIKVLNGITTLKEVLRVTEE